MDPFRTVAKEMKVLTKNIRQLSGSGHPVLDTVSKYYSQSEGKYIRPMLVLLMSQATANASKTSQQPESLNHHTIDEPLSPRTILSDVNPSVPSLTDESTFSVPVAADSDILPSQLRLAELDLERGSLGNFDRIGQKLGHILE